MKILVLSDRFPPHHEGGAEQSTLAIALGLVDAGCEVSVLTWVPERGAVGTIEWEGMRIHRFWSKVSERFRAYTTVYHAPAMRALDRVLARERPHLVQAHHISNFISYAALSRCRQRGIPVVLTAHDPGAICHQKMICGVDLPSQGRRLSYEARPSKCFPCMRFRWFPFRNRLIRRTVLSIAHRFAVSRELARILEVNDLGEWEVLYNPFLSSIRRSSPENVAAFRQRFGIAEGVAVVGSGGRIGYWKGIEHLIRAAGYLTSPQRVPFRLVLCGRVPDHYRRRLFEVAREAGIADRLVLTGWLDGDGLAAFYGACTVVAVPSIIPDSLPRLTIESLAAGVPVVGTPFGGTPEIVTDHETGYVANPLVPEEFALGLARVIDDPDRARRMGVNGQNRVEERFSVEGNVSRRLELYRGLVGAARR